MDAQHEARALIRPVKESVEDELLAREGVVGVDIAEKISAGKPTGQVSIVVFVEKKKPGTRLAKGQMVPKEINGVVTDVQELEIELQSAMVKLDDGVGLVDATAYPSLHGGISMGPRRSVFLSPPEVPAAGNYVFVGTLGAMVRDRANGNVMALTNFHVACPRGWAIGDRMAQPSLVDNAAAATDFGSLARATLSEHVDGAVVRLDAGKDWTATIETIGNVAGTATATVGMPVQKRGRTTEHTFGTVRSTDFTATINYGGDSKIAVVKDVQRNPVKRIIEHVDFYEVKAGEKIDVEVPVFIEGTPKGAAVAFVDIQELKVRADVSNLPERIVINVDGMTDGSKVFAKDIELPEGAELDIDDPEESVVTVEVPEDATESTAETADTAAAAPAADAGAPAADAAADNK